MSENLIERLEQWPSCPTGADPFASTYVGPLMKEAAAEITRLREEWAQEGIGWLRDKDIDRLMGFEAENERLRAAVDMARSRLTVIRNGEAFQPHLHAAAGLDEINDLLASV